MNGQSFHDMQTVNTPAVSIPAPVTADLQLPTDAYTHLNQMLDMKLATVIIKKQKIQYSIVHFKDFNEEWMMCEVENLSGVTHGEDLVILVQKITPLTIYITGAVKNPPTFTAN